MHIDKYEEAMMNCRFCFMCRHLSTIGQVRCTEVDTPRIRAAMLYGLKTGTNSFDDSDFVDALYRQELSACCTHHCVNHYDENGLALAARADVVEAGKAPEAVKKLAAKFAKRGRAMSPISSTRRLRPTSRSARRRRSSSRRRRSRRRRLRAAPSARC